MVAFKGTIRRYPFRGGHIYITERKDLKYEKWVYKACTVYTMHGSISGRDMLKYIKELNEKFSDKPNV